MKDFLKGAINMYYMHFETDMSSEMLNELVKPYLASISSEVYLIAKGVRSCAWVDLPEELVIYIEKSIIDLFNSEGLYYYVLPFDLMEDNEIKKHIQIFIYRYDWQKKLFIHYINKRDSLTGDFIFGKLLGYSDSSINEFFSKNRINKL